MRKEKATPEISGRGFSIKGRFRAIFNKNSGNASISDIYSAPVDNLYGLFAGQRMAGADDGPATFYGIRHWGRPSWRGQDELPGFEYPGEDRGQLRYGL